MDRQGIKSLFKDMNKGLFNTIIVKDLSRFSRNYKDAGLYLEQKFPSYNIRFISLSDNYDSINGEEDSLSLETTLMHYTQKIFKRKSIVHLKNE